jgi:hypothetical protein
MSRTPIDRALDALEWSPLPVVGEMPEHDVYAEFEAVLVIAGMNIRVYHLTNGERVLHADDMELFFGAMEDL